MKRKLLIEVTEELLVCAMKPVVPCWYGVAYRKCTFRTVIFAPIPLNLLVRWSMNLYWWARAWKSSYRERELERSFAAGRKYGGEQMRQHLRWVEEHREELSKTG